MSEPDEGGNSSSSDGGKDGNKDDDVVPSPPPAKKERLSRRRLEHQPHLTVLLTEIQASGELEARLCRELQREQRDERHAHQEEWRLHQQFLEGEAGGVVEDEASADVGVPARPLSPALRLYVYALHGCLCEVVFTAVLDWCSSRDSRLPGHSSLWALPMYATAIYLMENFRSRLLAQSRPLLVRLTAYTLFIYLWEFSWGSALRLLGACPWDYSGYRYNVGGLVTLEYALPWTVAAFIAEQHVIRNTLRIRLHC
ncbi:transmembrane protein 229B-like [Salarias fasciatus]|uniref:transmembrane protein 229B-like n=1 Tax=Salarias fasciatus TaxID=181472 RepID=UPI0011769A10|nr:transmembrane protein 229B-like [Salarias fasciatus]